MASDLSYGEGGLRFPQVRVGELVQPSNEQASLEESWAAKCEDALTNYSKLQPASIWDYRDPSPSPRRGPDRGEMNQNNRREIYQQSEIHDGWFPETGNPDQASRSAKPPVPEGYPLGNATLTYSNERGELVSIPGLNLELIEERSLLLATAFEGSQSGQRLYLETLCELTAMPLLRYLYTGSYAEYDHWDEVPTSLLLHCKMYQLGLIYDINELEKQAKYNITRQCVFGCSSPEKPIDLCQAIRFAYDDLKGNDDVISEVLHYCVSRFLSHNLGEDAEFRDLAYDLRPFHQDLAKTCKDRGYADESAAAIIQLPYKPYRPDTYASTETPAISRFEDLVFHFHGADDSEETSPSKRARRSVTQNNPVMDKGKQRLGNPPRPASAFTLSLRQCAQEERKPEINSTARTKEKPALPIRTRSALKAEHVSTRFTEDISASEDEDMLIVRKRKLPHPKVEPGTAIASGSDSDFELLSGPETVLSPRSENDNESDTATLVDVSISSKPEHIARNTTSREPPAVSDAKKTDDDDLEWEWEDVL